jgi:hypothetical protein
MIPIFNFIREANQTLDTFLYQEPQGQAQKERILHRAFLIMAIAASAFDGAASFYEGSGNPVFLCFRHQEIAARIVLLSVGGLLKFPKGTQNISKLSALTLCNLGLTLLFPQYTALRFAGSTIEACLRAFSFFNTCKTLVQRYSGI